MSTINNSSRKTILFLHAGAELYGADKVLLELTDGLHNSDYRPLVVLPENGPLVNELNKHSVETLIIQYPILRRNMFNLIGLIKYIFSYVNSLRKLIKISKENDVQLIHVNTVAVFEGVALKKILKVPLVWHVHEIITTPRIVNKVICWIVGKSADLVVAVSNAVANHLQDSGYIKKNKIRRVYNGVASHDNLTQLNRDSEILKKNMGIPKFDIVIGMIGRINSWKGQSDLLTASEYTLRRITNSHLVMIGGVFSGEEWRLNELQQAIGNSRYSERIHLLDFQQHITAYNNMFDIFVLPSINPDPLPTVVLESMSLGKTVLGYKHGGIQEMVTFPDNVLVTPKNIELLSKKIFEFASSKELRQEEGTLNKIRQEKFFNTKLYHKNFIEIYDELLGK